MKKLRYSFRLSTAFVSRFKGILFIGIILGVAIFFLLNFIIPPMLRKTEERIGVTGRYHIDEIPNSILSQISDGLTSIDEDGSATPNLAKSWETPDKGKTWIFTLDTNRKWHDGENVNSDSIVYEFSDVEIERPSPDTIIFKLEEPFSPFPTIVSRPTFKKGLIGTGLWEVDNLQRVGGYVSEISLISKDEENNYTFKRIYRFYPTTDQAKFAFKYGSVDSLVNVLDPTPFDAWDSVELKNEEEHNQIVSLFFNAADPLLGDKSIRQALTYGINKEDLSGNRALSPISPDSWAYNPQVKPYSFDPERAKELLEDLPEEQLQNPIQIVTTPYLLPIAEEIKTDWEEIGINSEVRVSSIVPNEFQVYLTIFDIPNDPDQYPFWHSTQDQTNISNYSSPRIDKLLEDGRIELNLEDRKKVYLDFQRFLLEDLPAAFLFYPEMHTISRK